MIEPRSGGVSLEFDEIVTVFEPATKSRFTLAAPTTVESLGFPLVEGKFTVISFEELAFTFADAGEPERYRISTECSPGVHDRDVKRNRVIAACANRQLFSVSALRRCDDRDILAVKLRRIREVLSSGGWDRDRVDVRRRETTAPRNIVTPFINRGEITDIRFREH